MSKEQKDMDSSEKFVQQAVYVVCGILLIAAVIVFGVIEFGKKFNDSKPPTVVPKVIVAPDFLKKSLENLKSNTGTIEQQHRDIDVLSKSLNDHTITSESLGQKGNSWLSPLRMRVDVREAVVAWEEIRKIDLEVKAPRNLSNSEIRKGALTEKAEKLHKLIASQIESPFAEYEGLEITHGDLYEVIARIRNGGKDPE